jgi:hypothetical protein
VVPAEHKKEGVLRERATVFYAHQARTWPTPAIARMAAHLI